VEGFARGSRKKRRRRGFMISFRELKNIDYFLLVSVMCLLASGWFVLYSASQQEEIATGIDFTQKQFIWMSLAVFVFFVFLLVDYHFLVNISFIIYGIVIILLLAVLFFGGAKYGAKRWINIAGFTLQPSEVAKLGVILAVVKYMIGDMEDRHNFRYIVLTGAIIIFPLLLIYKQPDLGTTLIFVPAVFAMLFIAGMRWVYVVFGLVVVFVSMPVVWNFLRPYQKARVITFINPESDPFGTGYSIIQSKIAIGSGGIIGKGWLGGTQNRLNFIPERHTDFIFSVVGEEWGFLGVLFVVILFFIAIASGFNIARKAPDVCGKFLALGIVVMFAAQVSVNIGMTIGLLPVTGIPLPFMSYGGTSLVVTMAMIGILQNIYMKRFMF
jgi:rod shape determining protein RodA